MTKKYELDVNFNVQPIFDNYYLTSHLINVGKFSVVDIDIYVNGNHVESIDILYHGDCSDNIISEGVLLQNAPIKFSVLLVYRPRFNYKYYKKCRKYIVDNEDLKSTKWFKER